MTQGKRAVLYCLWGILSGLSWEGDLVRATDLELEQAQAALQDANDQYYKSIRFTKLSSHQRSQAYEQSVGSKELGMSQVMQNTLEQNLSALGVERGEVEAPANGVKDWTPETNGKKGSAEFKAQALKKFTYSENPSGSPVRKMSGAVTVETVEPEPVVSVSQEKVEVEEVIYHSSKSKITDAAIKTPARKPAGVRK